MDLLVSGVVVCGGLESAFEAICCGLGVDGVFLHRTVNDLLVRYRCGLSIPYRSDRTGKFALRFWWGDDPKQLREIQGQ
jgi:hypothetical protein